MCQATPENPYSFRERGSVQPEPSVLAHDSVASER